MNCRPWLQPRSAAKPLWSDRTRLVAPSQASRIRRRAIEIRWLKALSQPRSENRIFWLKLDHPDKFKQR
jgi:hypothetical protein